ncbi:MAG: YidC/Oxa1 family membrane protein insertase [Massiliimalia sp.]|jgi:YidC/Oxa1 family membrane protein insertase
MGFLGTPLGWIMKFMYQFIQNYGVVLILFTVLVRLALFPLGVKQQKSSAKMAIFTPKMQQLQKQYGKNKQKYQEEMMKLYEEEGYNPMSSCLPMVIQMVVLFGIIDVVYKPLKHLLSIPTDLIQKATDVLTEAGVKATSSAELLIINVIQGNGVNPQTHEALDPHMFDSIFSADMIGQIQDFNTHLFGLNLGTIPTFTWPIILIPILSGVTSLLVSVFSMKQQAKNGMANQQGMGAMKAMMYIMPLFSAWIAFSLPTGVGFYWIVSNVLMFIQTVVLYKVYSPEKMKAVVEKENEERKKKQKNSRYRQAMAMAMEQQKAEEAKKAAAAANKKPGKKKAPVEEEPTREITAESLTSGQIIAMSRKQAADKYGDDQQMDAADEEKLRLARQRMAEKYGD